MWIAALLACRAEPASDAPGPEPLDLPDDPSAPGVPVGVRTESWQGRTLEVWYPASDAAVGAGESVDFAAFVPASVTALLGTVTFPLIPTRALRDAPLRLPETPYPVIVFSHGFGGTRLQSVDLTTHLASRGYVVVATDHVGRSMTELLPCLFTPPADGCDLSGFGSDPGEVDAPLLADWAAAGGADGWLTGVVDPTALGLTGHSAGGGTTTSVGEVDPRFRALLPMAGGGPVSRDIPELMLIGGCDGIVPASGLVDAVDASPFADRLTLPAAGHLAFSDLCALHFDEVYDTYLAPRDDLNALIADSLLALGLDGCPSATPAPEVCAEGAYLDLERSAPIVRDYATRFFDATLRGGAPVPGDLYPEATLETAD
jgi:dienelactone hydrolase